MNNIKIMGEGTVGKGIYNKISIMGEGDILGKINAKRISILGNGRSEEKIETNALKVSGSFRTKSNVKVNEFLKVSGNAIFNESVISEDIKISGEAEFKSGLNTKKIKVLGKCDVFGDCEGEKITGRGEINVDGLMTADYIDLKLFNSSRIKEIGGENIKITKGKSFFMFRGAKESLYSDVIEGDNIELTNTICKIVRGNNVVINSGCKIGRVEYKDKLQINNNSEVEEKLWRKS